MRMPENKTKSLGMITLALAFVSMIWIFAADEQGLQGVVSLVLIVATGLLMIATLMSAVRTKDELQARILVEALALAFGGVTLLVFVQIGLDEMGRPLVVEPGILLALLDGLFLLGYFVARRRYR